MGRPPSTAKRLLRQVASGESSAAICVLDARNLESRLYLLLQMLEKGFPTVAVLNRMDLTQEKGYQNDPKSSPGK